MSPELDRFLKLFDALTVSTNNWLAKTPKQKWDWVPFDNPSMKFGDRISTITIRSLFVHTITGEVGWANMLKDCDEGAALKPMPDPELTKQLMASDDLVGESMKLHKANMELFASYDDAQLGKWITWVGRDWTVMGFLWGIYSHRSYHLGNIDLYVREADETAPDFFSTFQQVLA